MINIEEFRNSDLQDKITSIVEANKKKLISTGTIDEFIYLFDSKQELYAVPIDGKKYLNNKDYKMIFRDVIKEIINDFAYEEKVITHLFYISESYFNIHYKNLNNVNLDVTFNSTNANESLLVYVEDKINMTLLVFDEIIGGGYKVISEKPIKKLEYCKLDPDDNLKGTLTNILR